MGYGPNTLTTAPLRWYNVDHLLFKGRRLRSADGLARANILQRAVVSEAAIAQLGERETEDLKVPSSILGLGNCGNGFSLFAALSFRAVFAHSFNVASHIKVATHTNLHLARIELATFSVLG